MNVRRRGARPWRLPVNNIAFAFRQIRRTAYATRRLNKQIIIFDQVQVSPSAPRMARAAFTPEIADVPAAPVLSSIGSYEATYRRVVHMVGVVYIQRNVRLYGVSRVFSRDS